MSRVSVRAACVALAALAPIAASAQGAPATPGARIRVSVRGDRAPRVGTLVAVRGDSLTFVPADDGATRALPVADVARIEVSRGLRRHTVDGLVIGAASGVAIGVAIGFASGNDPRNQFLSYTAADKAGLLGAALGTIGLATGAVIGAFHRSERWVPAALQPVGVWIAPAMGRRPGVNAGVTLRL